MKVSVSPRRISRSMIKFIVVLFIFALIVISYSFTSLTAFAMCGACNGPSHHKSDHGTHDGGF